MAASYGLTGGELDAFTTTFDGLQPRPQLPNAYRIERPVRMESRRKFAGAEILLDDWTDPNDPKPIGITVACGGQDLWAGGTTDDEIGQRFLAILRGLGEEASHLVVWSGMGVVFHTFLRHLARPMIAHGCVIQPLVSGADIKAIIVRDGGRTWTLSDVRIMSGATRLDQDAACSLFGVFYAPTQTRARIILSCAERLQEVMMATVGVAPRPTIAASAMRAASYYLPADRPWYRPNIPLEAVCRYGGAYRGGYTYSEDYRGPGYRIDVTKMYTSLLRNPLPGSCALTHAGQYGREYPGIFLCRVEGEGYFPGYIAPFTLADRRFHKQNASAPSAWTWLPSAELVGMRALGYKVVAGLGFRFTQWVSLRGFADHLLSVHSRYPPNSAETVVAKAVGNAVTGKLGQSPDRLEVCYSLTEPSGGWLPYVTAERLVIPDLWWKRKMLWSGSQHVDAAAWLTAQGRGKMYSQLARIRQLGWRAVHVDTDGAILDSDPRGVLPLSSGRAGEWRFDGYDPDCLVARTKWYSFQGEVHTAGLSNVTRQQLEAVHYGKRVTMGRYVLSNPLASGPIGRQADYQMGVA